MQRIRYFDHSATTAIEPRVLNEMMPYLTESFGNASSVYSIVSFLYPIYPISRPSFILGSNIPYKRLAIRFPANTNIALNTAIPNSSGTSPDRPAVVSALPIPG